MSPPFVIEPMISDDVAEILEIERASFLFPWSERAFLAELALPYAVYRVARWTVDGLRRAQEVPARPRWRWWSSGDRGVQPAGNRRPVVGYAGLQVIFDEGHITTIAVHPDYRRRSIGEALLLHLFDEARPRGVLHLTLEVRVSNLGAQQLYRRYGFAVEGRRRRYYGDGEDAYIMWTGRLDTAESQARLEELHSALLQRLAAGGEP